MNDRYSRRQFMKKASFTLGAALAAPYLIPSRALGADGAVAPSNRITMGCIGLGGMGTGNMQAFLNQPEVQVVAVCDVDGKHRETARQSVDKFYADKGNTAYKGCAAYNDFRDLLARPDIDAVMIATPDHWHALIAVAAAEAGKDMYCEKPLALTLRQGQIMRDTINRLGRVFQTGSWQRSVVQFRQACELVRNGRIGQIKTIKVGLPACSAMPLQPAMPVPPDFDYNMWLGPAPWAPYTEKRCHWNFRYNLDYSGGHVTDWGAHHHDIVQWALGTEATGPVEFEGRGNWPRDGLFNVATDYEFVSVYANGIRMTTNSAFPNGILFEGTEGTIFVDRGHIEATPKSVLTSIIGPSDVHLYKSENHQQNFLECVKSRAKTITPVETAHRSISIAHLANIAMLLERKVKWDPEQEVIIGDAEANRMLSRGMRSPWQL